MATLTSNAPRDWTRDDVLEMHQAYVEGATLRQLGEEHGITYERVRQLFAQYGLSPKKVKRQTFERNASQQEAQDRREEIFEAYREHGTVEATARAVGIAKQFVSPILAEMELRQLYRRSGIAHSYDSEKIIKALQAAAKLCGEPLTIPAYRKIAPKKHFPADLTVIRGFGTWEAACEAAGVKANPAEGPRRGAISPDTCIASLRLCAADIGRVPSYELYCQWARENKMPSGPTVRVKVGPWREALLLAFSDSEAPAA